MTRLLPFDEPRLEALVLDPETCLDEICSNGPEVEAFLRPLLRPSLEFHRRLGSTAPWHSYFAIESNAKQLVGLCSFKGNPNAAGEVEISYGTLPGFESRGYATQMAAGLVKIALQSSAIRRVIAHTLPEPNASTRVLQKAGLIFSGEVIDPEDGRVWRWEIPNPEAPETR